MKAVINILKWIGIEKVDNSIYWVLGANLWAGTVYFRAFRKGAPQFTRFKEMAWKFRSREEAESCFNIGYYTHPGPKVTIETSVSYYRLPIDELFTEEVRG